VRIRAVVTILLPSIISNSGQVIPFRFPKAPVIHRFSGLLVVALAYLLTWGSLPGTAQNTSESTPADSCARLAAAMDSALNAYGAGMQKAVDEVAPTQRDTPNVSGYGRIRWDRRSMDIPEITLSMHRRDLIYNVPQVTMTRREISFDVPDGTRGERIQTGCTPRTKVEGFPPRVTVWCEPIYITVPVPKFKKVRMSTDFAEVTMRPIRSAFSIPEARVTMKRISWSFPEYVSECTAINSDACEAEKERQTANAQATTSRINAALRVAAQAGAEGATRHVRAFFSCQRHGMQEQHSAMTTVYRTTVTQMEATLELMRVQGGSNSAEALETRAALARIQIEMPPEMEKLRAAIEELSTHEELIINSLWTTTRAENAL
jgi:hypothetical protein